MKIIQINLNHCEAAQDLLAQMAREHKVDAVLISEPFKIKDNRNWCRSNSKKAAIWTRNLAFQEINDQKEGFVRAKINGIYFYSCYAPPSWTPNQYEEMLDEIVTDAENKTPIVIGGDFNAWAVEWGSRVTNTRGRILLEALARLNVIVANNGVALTYRKAGMGSIIDVTFVSYSLATRIKWWVSEEFTHSDHQAVMFEINYKKRRSAPTLTGPKWNDKRFDTEAFEYMLQQQEINDVPANNLAHNVTNLVTVACDASMPRRKPRRQESPCYWWNDDIAQLRRNCLQARRRVQRSRHRPNFEQLLADFRCARKTLQKAIKESKNECFRKLCAEANIDPWGTAYKMVMKRMTSQRAPQISCPNMLQRIVSTLFPQRMLNIPGSIEINREDIPAVTENELLEACKKIGDRKAPGPDGVPNSAIKLAINSRPEIFVETFQKCLEEGKFPKIWKIQRLVLIPKGNKPADDPSSYRPICLLDTMGKILERLVYNRLLPIVEEKRALSDRQFGFRKSRSTIDAIKMVIDTAADAIEGERWRWGAKEYCAVTTLDVKNAFNSAEWPHVLESLREVGVPSYILSVISDYLSERQLIYDSDEGIKTYKVTAGVPQGSVLGPLLWNIMYDHVLRLSLPREAKIVGFADDIAVVTVAKHIADVENITNIAVAQIKRWLELVGLRLAEHKTETVLITSRKKIEYMRIQVGEQSISSQNSLKYLGVVIDNRLNFKAHIEYVSKKAANIQAALSRILPNIGGPKSSRRALLANVTSSVLLYAAPIWAGAMKLKTNKRKLLSVNRLSALRAICGYRTISDEAAFVIAGIIPVDILADEMKRVYDRCVRQANVDKKEVKSEERTRSIHKWQERWNTTDKGRWTYKLIPDLTLWLNRRSGETNYHLTQFLSGHGGFRKYLNRFGHDDSPMCPTCPEIEEDVEHVMFHCPRFTQESALPEPSSIIAYMMESEGNWSEVTEFAASIQRELRRIEAVRRGVTGSTGDSN